MDSQTGAPVRIATEEALFDAARALPAKQRALFLEQACAADPDLRRRLEVLLQADLRAGDFLEPAAAVPAAGPHGTMLVTPPPDEKPGDSIGPYKIREKLGEGGCGVVYVAEQTEPVRRRVALKIIKLGMDTRSVIARFEAERQALAMMDHPNIAKVLDAGTTSTGRPYFAMELVRGIKITDYCDQHNLATGERLDLFIEVCHAVQHAHQKGVIHRDIKPSNILVTLHDGVPVPKVIDFGIAKATEGRLTDLTIYTELYQFIGTPAYMSPEQAEMSGLDIDTRTDIYSLGVLLYELLTGRTPFDGKELIQSGLDQMRRTIREKEPLPPSTRLSTLLDAERASIAKRHGSEVPRLIHLLRGDLDWIVMKALEKDRTRRFATANELALDVQRFCQDEPVAARPPSSLYRFRKLVRRNQAAFAAAAAVLTVLVLGLAVSLRLYWLENQAYRRAIAAEKQEAALRVAAENGWALEKRMREMAPLAEKFTTAGYLLSQGEFDKAEALMSQITTPVPASSAIYNVIGDQHGRHGEWGPAILNFSRAIQADPTNHIAYHYLTPLLLETGDLAGYQQHRERILRQFGAVEDPMVAERMAKDCLLVPSSAQQLPAIVRLADTAYGAGPTHHSWRYFQFVKGLADYRQARFEDAVQRLEPVALDESEPARAVQALMVLAMAQHQMKHTEEARATFSHGLKLAEAKVPQRDGINWHDRRAAYLLMREARMQIEPGASNDAAAK